MNLSLVSYVSYVVLVQLLYFFGANLVLLVCRWRIAQDPDGHPFMSWCLYRLANHRLKALAAVVPVGHHLTMLSPESTLILEPCSDATHPTTPPTGTITW